VVNDTTATISNAFSADLVGEGLNVLPKNEQNARKITVKARGAVDVTTKIAATMANGEEINLDFAQHERSSPNDFVDPIVVDSTAADALVTLMRY
jgi:hypothetical protein